MSLRLGESSLAPMLLVSRALGDKDQDVRNAAARIVSERVSRQQLCETLPGLIEAQNWPQAVLLLCISPGGLFSNQAEAFLERYCRKVPLGRMAGHDDIKGVVVFFASDASAYITGENILMDGGLHA